MTNTPRWLRWLRIFAAVLNVMACGFCLGDARWLAAIVCGGLAAALLYQILRYP